MGKLRTSPDDTRVKFDNVPGIDQAKEVAVGWTEAEDLRGRRYFSIGG